MRAPGPSFSRRVRHSLARHMPARDTLSSHPLLRPVARHLLSPRLWTLQHESVSRGVAIGLFWAFVMPIAQIPIAVAHCVWWRANIPVAVLATLVTNPLTLGFWLWAAFQVGTLVLDAPPPVMPAEGTGLFEWLQTLGLPVLLGMGLFAAILPALGYGAVRLGWRVRVLLRRRGRRRANQRQSP